MNIDFKNNGQYTLVTVNVMCSRKEITILGTDPISGRKMYKEGKGRKKLLMPLNFENILVFEGHSLPFLLDSETNRFIMDCHFHFLTDNAQELREFISSNCLNPDEYKFSRIYFSPKENRTDDKISLFPVME